MNNLALLACESFIQRAATFDSPFVLKGSFLTRQFCPSLSDRIPADLDWYCLQKLSMVDNAMIFFNIWLMTVVNTKLNDGVEFNPLVAGNINWENTDYADYQEFTTIGTVLEATVKGQTIRFYIEISYNWPIHFTPKPILYKNSNNEQFNLSKTIPLYLQIAWKIHQCIIEPRMKDFVDLSLLLQHQSIDNEMIALIKETAEEEAIMSGVFADEFFEYNFDEDEVISESRWEYWRMDNKEKYYDFKHFWDTNTYSDFYGSYQVPEKLDDFYEYLTTIFEKAGFDPRPNYDDWD